jgi:hypothetical protein
LPQWSLARFAREGARVFLGGRIQPALVRVADAIHGTGGTAEVATVDALERSVKYLPRWHTFSAPTAPRDSYDQLRGEGETA